MDAKQVHQTDQAVASARSIAAVFAGLYRGLIEEGVPRGDALQIVIAYARGFHAATQRPPEGQ